MKKLSLDPLIVDDIDPVLRDSVQLNLQKLQDYVNLLSQSVNPTGAIVGLESAIAPPGYVLADGSTFLATTYPELATYLGGTTLPDYRGRVLVGLDGTTEFLTLGQTGGSKTSTAPHTHGLNGHSHGGNTNSLNLQHFHTVNSHNHGGGTGAHAHNVVGEVGTSSTAHDHHGASGQVAACPGGANFFTGVDGSTNTVGVANTFETPNTDNQLNPSTFFNIAPDNGNTSASSAGATAGNLQPYRVVNWYIKT